MRHICIIVVCCLSAIRVAAYNPFWIHQDKKMIAAIVRLNKNNPLEIEQAFTAIQKNHTTKENLGFGWSMWTTGLTGGYIYIAASFYYYHDSLVSYSLMPQLPEERGLIKRYKRWYKDYFSYSGAAILPFDFNIAAIVKPLQQYKGEIKDIPECIARYMSPGSGTMYGYGGGGVMMQNRKTFLAIKDSLDHDQLILLLYSINPASRLTAIEYYWKHKDQYQQQPFIDDWIEQNFKEMPVVQTMSGCFRVTEETRSYVYMFSLMADR